MTITVQIDDSAIDEIIPTGGELRCFPYDSEVTEKIEWLSRKLGESYAWFEEDITNQIIDEVKQRTKNRKREVLP